MRLGPAGTPIDNAAPLTRLARPRSRTAPFARVFPVDRAAPTSPAGSDPAKVAVLLSLEPHRRQRNGNGGVHPVGSSRWPVR